MDASAMRRSARKRAAKITRRAGQAMHGYAGGGMVGKTLTPTAHRKFRNQCRGKA